LQEQGKFEKARQLYRDSLEIAVKLGDQFHMAHNLNGLGTLEEREGDKAHAAQLYREALDIFEKLKSPVAEITRQNLAHVEGEFS
jgi:tetratricopeptide (TPR) repeat protein